MMKAYRSPLRNKMIKAVIFDLDDTLFPEEEYVKSGFKAIAKHFNDNTLYGELWKLFKENKNDVYQRAGFNDAECKKCIEIYRSHKPVLKLEKKTYDLLILLRKRGFKLGIITDGRPEGQWNKIHALALDKLTDKIIVTDELGGESFRKPNSKAFEIMRDFLDVKFEEMMYIGDNPAKDFYIGSIYPITTVHLISNRLYKNNNYYKNIYPTYTVSSLHDIIFKGGE